MRSNFTPGKASLIAWLIVMSATLVWTASAVRSGNWLRSNIFELLPNSDYDALKEEATRVVESELGAQLLFLVGHTDREIAKASAEQVGRELRLHRLIDSAIARVDIGQFATIASFLLSLPAPKTSVNRCTKPNTASVIARAKRHPDTTVKTISVSGRIDRNVRSTSNRSPNKDPSPITEISLFALCVPAWA